MARSRISQDRELQFRPPVTWDKMASMDMGDLLSCHNRWAEEGRGR